MEDVLGDILCLIFFYRFIHYISFTSNKTNRDNITKILNMHMEVDLINFTKFWKIL